MLLSILYTLNLVFGSSIAAVTFEKNIFKFYVFKN